jgi:DNA topoisomerase VI subunit B
MSDLTRTVFTTSRLLEFTTVEELTKLVGFGPDRWPMIVAKEAIDNALDACEEANTAPEITVAVSTKGTISVTDNGPGIRCAGSRSPDPRTQTTDLPILGK